MLSSCLHRPLFYLCQRPKPTSSLVEGRWRRLSDSKSAFLWVAPRAGPTVACTEHRPSSRIEQGRKRSCEREDEVEVKRQAGVVQHQPAAHCTKQRVFPNGPYLGRVLSWNKSFLFRACPAGPPSPAVWSSSPLSIPINSPQSPPDFQAPHVAREVAELVKDLVCATLSALAPSLLMTRDRVPRSRRPSVTRARAVSPPVSGPSRTAMELDDMREASADRLCRTDPARAIAIYPASRYCRQRYPPLFAVPNDHFAEILSRYPHRDQEGAMITHMLSGYPEPPMTLQQRERSLRLRNERRQMLQVIEGKLDSMVKILRAQPPPPNAPALRDMIDKSSLLRNSLILEVKLRSWQTFPFNDLPPEILDEIFRYAIHDAGGIMDTVRTRAHLSQVCRLWRNVVNTDATLWNSLLVVDEYPWRLTEQHIERSGSTSIDIRVNDQERIDRGSRPLCGREWRALVDVLFTKLPQIRALLLDIRDVEDMHYVTARLEAVASGVPLRLERLELYVQRPWLGQPSTDKPAVLFGGCDVASITSLSLKGIPLDWKNSFVSNLTVFDVRRVAYDRWLPLERFREILVASPHLEKLVLNGAGPVMPNGWHNSDLPPIHLPKLTTLTLGDFSLSYAVFLWRQLHVPKIKDLTILNFYGDDYTPFIELLIGCTSNVRILTWYSVAIHGGTHNEAVMRRWFNSMTKLRYLRLSGVQRSGLSHFLLDDGRTQAKPSTSSEDAAVGPVLGNLVAVEWENVDPDDVAYLVRRRRELGKPLKRLYTAHDSWQRLLQEPNASASLSNLMQESRDIMLLVPNMSQETPEEVEALADDIVVVET